MKRGSHNPFDHPRNPNDNLMYPETLPNPRPTPAQKPAAFSTPREALLARIENDYTYRYMKGDQAQRYGLIRETAKKLARVMAENCPASRELSTALTNLEAAVFNANAAIDRNE